MKYKTVYCWLSNIDQKVVFVNDNLMVICLNLALQIAHFVYVACKYLLLIFSFHSFGMSNGSF